MSASDSPEGMQDGEKAALDEALRKVAHAAWHLLDDGGEQDDDPEEFAGFMSDAQRLSDALDALEALGWEAHPEDRPTPSAASEPMRDEDGNVLRTYKPKSYGEVVREAPDDARPAFCSEECERLGSCWTADIADTPCDASEPMRDEEGNELRVYRPKSYGEVVREAPDAASQGVEPQ